MAVDGLAVLEARNDVAQDPINSRKDVKQCHFQTNLNVILRRNVHPSLMTTEESLSFVRSPG